MRDDDVKCTEQMDESELGRKIGGRIRRKAKKKRKKDRSDRSDREAAQSYRCKDVAILSDVRRV